MGHGRAEVRAQLARAHALGERRDPAAAKVGALAPFAVAGELAVEEHRQPDPGERRAQLERQLTRARALALGEPDQRADVERPQARVPALVNGDVDSLGAGLGAGDQGREQLVRRGGEREDGAVVDLVGVAVEELRAREGSADRPDRVRVPPLGEVGDRERHRASADQELAGTHERLAVDADIGSQDDAVEVDRDLDRAPDRG